MNKKDPTGKSWDPATLIRKEGRQSVRDSHEAMRQSVESVKSTRLGSGPHSSTAGGNVASTAGSAVQAVTDTNAARLQDHFPPALKLLGKTAPFVGESVRTGISGANEFSSGNGAHIDVIVAGAAAEVGATLASSASGARAGAVAGKPGAILGGVVTPIVFHREGGGVAANQAGREGYVSATNIVLDAAVDVHRMLTDFVLAILGPEIQ